MDQKTLVGILGGLVLAASLVAVLAVEGSQTPAERTFPVAWDTQRSVNFGATDTLQEGENETRSFLLDHANLTRVDAWLNWTDDVGEPDEFRLVMQTPTGERFEEANRNGSIRFTAQPNPLPSLETTTAANKQDARRQLAPFTTHAGTGTWTLQVNLTDAPGQRPVPQAPQLETEPDGANAYHLDFAVYTYQSHVNDATASPGS